MAGFELTLGGEEAIRNRLARLEPRIRLQAARHGLERAALLLVGHIKRGKLSGSPLKVRSGRLRASIAHRIEETPDGLAARIGPHTPYARIHEFGGTVTARRTTYLTIPLRASLTPSGVSRYRARDLIAAPGLGGFTGTFFRNKILFGKTSGGQPVPLFKLQRSVRIPARPYLRPALAERREDIVRAVSAELKKAVEEP